MVDGGSTDAATGASGNTADPAETVLRHPPADCRMMSVEIRDAVHRATRLKARYLIDDHMQALMRECDCQPFFCSLGYRVVVVVNQDHGFCVIERNECGASAAPHGYL